jgi:hypothetical protein
MIVPADIAAMVVAKSREFASGEPLIAVVTVARFSSRIGSGAPALDAFAPLQNRPGLQLLIVSLWSSSPGFFWLLT